MPEDKQLPAVRSPDGKWVKGQSGNPHGRPPGRKNQLTELKQDLEIAVRRNITPRQISEIVQSLYILAVNGNVAAAKVLLDKVVSNAKDGEDAENQRPVINVIVENATIGAPQKKPVQADIIDGEIVEPSPTKSEDS